MDISHDNCFHDLMTVKKMHAKSNNFKAFLQDLVKKNYALQWAPACQL